MVTTVVLDIVLGFAAAIIVAWFSRQREFRADAGAAQLMGSKQPMMNALARLGGLPPGELPQGGRGHGHHRQAIGKLFSTPPADRGAHRGAAERPLMLPRAAWFALLALGSALAQAERIGDVDTAFKLIGPDHKVVVEAYDDPRVNGVTCYVSRARTGGVSGALGLAEDKAEASIACRQVGPISVPQPLPRQRGNLQ